jgi:hypothetical protein
MKTIVSGKGGPGDPAKSFAVVFAGEARPAAEGAGLRRTRAREAMRSLSVRSAASRRRPSATPRCAEFEGAQRRFGAAFGQRRYHHHRRRPQAHQPRQEVESVHAWHLDVERYHVGVEVADHLACGECVVRGADALHVGLAIDDLGQQAAHQRRVVHHEHAGLVHGRRWANNASRRALARRLTSALPLAGRKQTLRAQMPWMSRETTGMRSVFR